MSGNDSTPVIPREFFDEQVSNVVRIAKEEIDGKRNKYLSTAEALKRAIDDLAGDIRKSIRRILRGGGITDKGQLETLCSSVREELKRDKRLLHFGASEIISLIENGLEQTSNYLHREYGHVIAQLPEGDPANQREGFFEELRKCGVDEENATERVIAKVNAITYSFTPEFFESLSKLEFDDQLSASQVREFKQMFNVISGEVRASISGHVQRNPKMSFEVLQKNILEVLEKFNFKTEELPEDVIEIFKAIIIRDLKQYIETTQSVEDFWNLTTDSREETISCEEIQGNLCPGKVAYLKNEDKEKIPYTLTDAEENYILRLYLSMDKGFKAQTHAERIEAIAELSNEENHAGLNIRTPEDVDRLLEDIPRFGSENEDEANTSDIIALMKKIDGAPKAPREIGQALVRFREGFANEAQKFHELRIPDSEEVNRLNKEIADIGAEIDLIEDEITKLIEQLGEFHEKLNLISELAKLRAETEKTVSEEELTGQAEQFEQYLQTLQILLGELKKINTFKFEIEQIQASLEIINENIDRGEKYIGSTFKGKVFGADPKAILGKEYSHILDYTPDKDLDLKLGSIETACDRSISKIEELKKRKMVEILLLAHQVATAYVIVKDQLGEFYPEDLIKLPEVKEDIDQVEERGQEVEDSPEKDRFTNIQRHTLLYSTSLGGKNRIGGLELPILERLLREIAQIDTVSEKSIIDDLEPLSDMDYSYINQSYREARGPKKHEREASDKLFIIWRKRDGTTMILPTHKGFEKLSELSRDFKLDENVLSDIRGQVRKMRIE